MLFNRGGMYDVFCSRVRFLRSILQRLTTETSGSSTWLDSVSKEINPMLHPFAFVFFGLSKLLGENIKCIICKEVSSLKPDVFCPAINT